MRRISDLNILREDPLPAPHEILSALPLTPEIMEHIGRSREETESILARRDKRILLICGPCSIDSPPAALEYAVRLKSIQEKISDKMFLIMRVYFEKPRTTVGWKGLVYDPDIDDSFHIEKGLRLARRLLIRLAEMGIPAATEFLEPIIPQYYADLISWAAIGARTSESQTHRQLASGLSMPVGFKNSTDGSIAVAVNAVRAAREKHSFLGVINDGRTGVFTTAGNPCCHIVLRGGFHAPNYTSEHIAFAKELMRREKITPSVVIDCSHANSRSNPVNQPEILNDIVSQINDGEEAISGVMLESYIKQGRQNILPDRGKLIPGLSVTDPCLGWEETERAVLDAYARLKI